jgi:hypothetical protein
VASSLIPEFGAWVSRVLEENGNPSLRQTGKRVDIPYTTIKNMKDGRQVSAETVILFARAFSQDIPTALRLARYEDLAALWEQRTHSLPTPNKEPDLDAEIPALLAAYQGLPVEMKAGIRAMIFAAHQEHQRNQTTHGKKAE